MARENTLNSKVKCHVEHRRSQLNREVERLEESCLHLAQAQFESATRKGARGRTWLVLIPGVVSAAVGIAVAVGGPAALGALAALAGITTAVASFLGVDRDASTHELAGKVLTGLRHEARFLREATAMELSDDQYHAEIKRLSDRYNSYQLSQPTPDPKAYAAARASIKEKKFEFDADEKQTMLAGPVVSQALTQEPQASLPAPKSDSEK